jgi:hypothetical protein
VYTVSVTGTHKGVYTVSLTGTHKGFVMFAKFSKSETQERSEHSTKLQTDNIKLHMGGLNGGQIYSRNFINEMRHLISDYSTRLHDLIITGHAVTC